MRDVPAAAHRWVRKVCKVRRKGAQTGNGTSTEMRKEEVVEFRKS